MPSLVNLEGEKQYSWNYDIRDPISEVNDLCRKRAEAADTRLDLNENLDSFAAGKLLLFYPNETLCDGAACQSSNGFFDNWNIPPWDTWIWYSGLPHESQVLYSWVPSQFIELASTGVSVNPEQCIRWATVQGFKSAANT
jgi:hypothetical protein